MADINASLEQEILDVAQGERETVIRHDREGDNLG